MGGLGDFLLCYNRLTQQVDINRSYRRDSELFFAINFFWIFSGHTLATTENAKKLYFIRKNHAAQNGFGPNFAQLAADTRAILTPKLFAAPTLNKKL